MGTQKLRDIFCLTVLVVEGCCKLWQSIVVMGLKSYFTQVIKDKNVIKCKAISVQITDIGKSINSGNSGMDNQGLHLPVDQ